MAPVKYINVVGVLMGGVFVEAWDARVGVTHMDDGRVSGSLLLR
jgi:hypothetical protein